MDTALDELSEAAPKIATTEHVWGKKARPDATVVYAIQMGDLPYIKLGITNSIEDRLHALQTSSPLEMHVVGKISASRRIEKSLHEMYRSSHERREWFRLDARVKSLVAAMAASDFGPELELHLIKSGVQWQSPGAVAVQASIAAFFSERGI